MIVYLGKNDNFFIDAQLIKEKLKVELKILDLSLGYEKLITELTSLRPKIIVIKIIDINYQLFSFFLIIKAHQKLKESKIVAYFPDKSSLESLEDVYSFGIEYGLLSGEEKEKALLDLGHFIDKTKFIPSKFAEAINLFIPATGHFISKISHTAENKLFIESFLTLNVNSEIKVTINTHKGERVIDTKVLGVNTFYPRSYFPTTYELEFSQADEYAPFKESYLQTQEQVFFRNDRVLIVDKRNKTLEELTMYLNQKNYFPKVVNLISTFQEQIKIFKPDIICFQMEEEKESFSEEEQLKYNGRASFNQLVQSLNAISNYAPPLLVFNQRSRSQAYRKAYNYENLITSAQSFSFETFQMIIDEYQTNKTQDKDTIYFRPPDPLTKFFIRQDLILTSLSENIITFLYPGDLKDYTNFKIEAPLNIYVMVIPPYRELEGRPKYKAYMGIITNTNEADKMEIRKLVNILIQGELMPNEEFVLKSVTELREDILNKKIQEIKELRSEQLKKITKEDES